MQGLGRWLAASPKAAGEVKPLTEEQTASQNGFIEAMVTSSWSSFYSEK